MHQTLETRSSCALDKGERYVLPVGMDPTEWVLRHGLWLHTRLRPQWQKRAITYGHIFKEFDKDPNHAGLGAFNISINKPPTIVTCQLGFKKSTPVDSHPGNVFHAHILNLICHPCLIRLCIHRLKKRCLFYHSNLTACLAKLRGRSWEDIHWMPILYIYKRGRLKGVTQQQYVFFGPTVILLVFLSFSRFICHEEFKFHIFLCQLWKGLSAGAYTPVCQGATGSQWQYNLIFVLPSPDNPPSFLLGSPVMIWLKLHILFLARFCW